MSFDGNVLSGRAARRKAQFGTRRKGAGWTRQFRKGREQRTPEAYEAPELVSLSGATDIELGSGEMPADTQTIKQELPTVEETT